MRQEDQKLNDLIDLGGYRHELYLGSRHWLDWVVDNGKRIGVVIYHPVRDTNQDYLGNGMCASGAQWADSEWQKAHPGSDVSGSARWDLLDQPDDSLSISPSIRCSCGDHGWIRDGKWFPA